MELIALASVSLAALLRIPGSRLDGWLRITFAFQLLFDLLNLFVKVFPLFKKAVKHEALLSLLRTQSIDPSQDAELVPAAPLVSHTKSSIVVGEPGTQAFALDALAILQGRNLRPQSQNLIVDGLHLNHCTSDLA